MQQSIEIDNNFILHPGQLTITDNAKRFNVVNCGHRFGKTQLAEYILSKEAIEGGKAVYFAPTYKMLLEVWRDCNYNLSDLIKIKSESEKRMELITGGSVDFWGLDNFDSVRGRKYTLAVIDEAAIVHNLKDAWEQVIRPLLTDYKGGAYFFSTPKGKGNYFYQLSENANKLPNSWAYFKMPTLSNPFIDAAEIDEAEKLLPPIVFSQEYRADFVATNFANMFIYSFKDSHVGNDLNIDFTRQVNISFDFNVEPITAIIGQHTPTQIRIIKEYRLLNSDIYELCHRIATDFRGARIIVTGDASGRNRSALTRGNKNYYHVIKSELKLSDRQFIIPSQNPSVANNRVLVNSILHSFPDFLIDQNCQFLIDDIRSVEVDDKGGINKKKDSEKTHLLDCFLYYIYTFFHNYAIKGVQTKAPRYVSINGENE